MKRINVYIGGEQHKTLRKIAKGMGSVSGYSQLIRNAIEEYISRQLSANNLKEAKQ